MPNFYTRKGSTSRGSWSAEALRNALEAVENSTMGINEAARNFGIPPSTLKRRKKSRNFSKENRLGPDSSLGNAAEAKIVLHIKKLQKAGFSPSREAVRIMAYDLAKTMNIKHKFNTNTGKAGYVWLTKFLRRHPELSIRKSEGVSLARSRGMSTEIVKSYFELLERTLAENNLFDKPGNIYNMDETGLQLNNKPGHVIAAKGSKSVAAITSGEKGETISVIACCSAEGVFLPPYCIFKGKNKKEEFSDGMPPGSTITMSQRSAYVNADIFLDWLKTHFVPRKMPGKVLLILDGHTSHTTSVEMLEFSEEHDVILLCLPSHTTHFLQPLDRAFFKSLKSQYYAACNNFIRTNPTRKLNRLQFGKLLGSAWIKSATVQNAVSAFRATGIVPFDPDAIPDYAFLLQNEATVEQIPDVNRPSTPSHSSNTKHSLDSSQPSTSKQNLTTTSPCASPNNISPGKLLDEVSPVPVISAIATAKKRGRSVANILNSPENINNVKDKRQTKKKNKAMPIAPQKTIKTIRKKKYEPQSDSSLDYDSPILNESEDSDEGYENECAGCGEDYFKTKKTEDWIKCLRCGRWMHDGCTKYTDMCDLCGKHAKK